MRLWSMLLGSAVSLHATPASADPTAADRDAARILGRAGQEKLKANDFRGAFEACKGAHEIMRVPSTGLCLAQAEIGLHMLVEAANTLHEIGIYPDAGKNPVFQKAQDDALQLEQEITPKIPELRIHVDPEPKGLRASVDGEAIPDAAVHLPRRVNPGKHRVVASAPGYGDASKSVTVNETEHGEVELTLLAGTARSAAEEPSDAVGVAEARGGGVPLWAWIAGGVGVAATGVSIGFAVDFGGAQSTFHRDCAETNSAGQPVCDPDRYSLDEATSLYGRRNRSAGIAVGFGVVAAAALTTSIVGFVGGKRTGKNDHALHLVPASEGVDLAGVF